MNRTFSHDEVFPLIAKVIIKCANTSGAFVSHDQIIDGLLAQTDAVKIINEAKITSKLSSERLIVSNMVSWFSKNITEGSSEWLVFFDRSKDSGVWAYRPKTALKPHVVEDLEISALEGEPRLFFHLRRERSSKLREAKIHAIISNGKPLACEACGMVAEHSYPALTSSILEVHHLLPLSSYAVGVETKLDDLALLCPNCHRAIHRMIPFVGIEEFRERMSFRKDSEQT